MKELLTTDLVTDLRSWVGFPKKELDELLEKAADKIEALEKRLGGINSLACYASEEDTDAQPTMLLKIGRVARGEEEVTWPTI